VSETRRSCIRSAAKLASADAVRQLDMLLIAEYIPTPSASSKPIEDTCSQRLRASRNPHLTTAALVRAAHRSPPQIGDLDLPTPGRAVAHDVSAGELDHPVGDAGDLPVMRDHEHRAARVGLSWSSSRI
jgi:hypothetical protein